MPGKKHYRRAGTAPPKNLPPKAWDPNKPPGGELPVSDAPPQNPAPPSKGTKSLDGKKIDGDKKQLIQAGISIFRRGYVIWITEKKGENRSCVCR